MVTERKLASRTGYIDWSMSIANGMRYTRQTCRGLNLSRVERRRPSRAPGCRAAGCARRSSLDRQSVSQSVRGRARRARSSDRVSPIRRYVKGDDADAPVTCYCSLSGSLALQDVGGRATTRGAARCGRRQLVRGTRRVGRANLLRRVYDTRHRRSSYSREGARIENRYETRWRGSDVMRDLRRLGPGSRKQPVRLGALSV